jgi:P27 family predicted phage terminase small subunit
MQPRKQPERRQDNRKARLPRNVPASALGAVPAPPKRLLRSIRADWFELWGLPQASMFTAADLPALRRLWLLRDERERARRKLEGTDGTTTGSRGQLVPHPLVARIAGLDVEIRHLETLFGLTPAARARLGLALEEVAKSKLEVLHESLRDPA